ncbi:hypothetical protein, conserved [Leishmania tarentolae]|uniref:Uncharacterized protein n=1 Tax=Leishmania tarentolae TaxID=5689 RepID=A0A640KKC6_LEITA|nr:hypothetical protein, conserved [Leishmania tarentolae]
MSSSASPLPSGHAHTARIGSAADAHRRQGDAVERPLVTSGDDATRKSATPHVRAVPMASASPDKKPFVRQRRLPSILLDSWEFRKLAAEGSVLANAMVSYDVDGDGLEEVIVGTTEGLLCVVKPDHREPLFLRVLAATISVVLYTPIQSRLVLVTLEGQCEITDHFLKPAQPPQTGKESAKTYWASSTECVDGGASVGGPPYGRTDSTSSLPRTSLSLNGGGRPAGGARSGLTTSSTAGRPWSAEGPMPTRVFHVPSNCLCADLSPERGTDLIFLGSYDRRFYVYSLMNGSCLVSLFLHDPITSVKSFAIPTSAPDTHPATTLSSTFVGEKRASNRASRCGSVSGSQITRTSCSTGVGGSGLLADSPRETETMSDRLAKVSVLSYVPLVFISTPTHLILLPAGLGDIQQWRKLQPKSAQLPLTVQLESDDSLLLPHQSTYSKPQQAPQKHTGGRPSLSSGESNPHEEGNAAPPHMSRVPLASSPGLRKPLQVSAETNYRVARAGNAPAGKASSRPVQLGVSTEEHRCDSAGVPMEGVQHTMTVSVPVSMTAAAAGAASGSPLSSSQLRCQARKRAIQAAEMGRPVLVKPLWALHIGRHALDVPLLQTVVSSHEYSESCSVPAAVAAGSPQCSSFANAIAQEDAPDAATGSPSADQLYGSQGSPTKPIQNSVRGKKTSQRAPNSSAFYVSLPSSTSAPQGGATVASNNTCNSTAEQRGTVTTPAGFLHRRDNDHSRDGGGRTEASSTTPALSAMGEASELNVPRSSWHTQTHSLHRRLRQCYPSNSSDEDKPAGGGTRCRSVEDDGEDAGSLSDDGDLSHGDCAAPVMSASDTVLRAQKEDGSEDGDYGTVTDEDFRLDRSGVSVTKIYSSSSDVSGRSSSGEVAEWGANCGRRALSSSVTRHSRQHHHHGTDTAEPASLACSLCHRRAESAPVVLMRRTRVPDSVDNGSGNASGTGLLETTSPTTAAVHMYLGSPAEEKSKLRGHQDRRWVAARRQGETGGRGSSQGCALQGSVLRQQYPQQHQSAHGTAPSPAVASSAPACAEVRLPTSVDVSVGASQVVVALSCEDGLALELRFSMVRLSSLSRSERRLPRGTVRLYDLKNPRVFHAKADAAFSTSRSATTDARPKDDVPVRDCGSGDSTRSASCLTSPEGACLLQQPHRHGSMRRQPQSKGASPVMYNIYLPTPVRGQAGTTATLSSLSHVSDLSFTSSHQQQCSRSGRRGYGDTSVGPTTTTVINTLVANATVTAGASLPPDDTGCYVSATADHVLGASTGDAPILDADGGTVRNSRNVHVQPHGEDTLVLRAQCLWAARLSESPLVQRSRVFKVRDSHLDNAFCTVFVAANGTCFAVDGDSLSVVECCIKEDCSSFTLMFGPLSTTPMLPAWVSATTLQEAPADASVGAKEGAVTGASAATMNFNALRGTGERTISCVCVSLDELCIYSVGEVNQLWGRRGTSASFPITSGVKEPISLLSWCLPDQSCARAAEAADASIGEADQGIDIAQGCCQAFMDPEEQALLLQLARKLSQHEQYAGLLSCNDTGTSADVASGREHSTDPDNEVLTRVKQLLLCDYSEQEWERLKWFEHALT